MVRPSRGGEGEKYYQLITSCYLSKGTYLIDNIICDGAACFPQAGAPWCAQARGYLYFKRIRFLFFSECNGQAHHGAPKPIAINSNALRVAAPKGQRS
jgi:hypothetical protein